MSWQVQPLQEADLERAQELFQSARPSHHDLVHAWFDGDFLPRHNFGGVIDNYLGIGVKDAELDEMFFTSAQSAGIIINSVTLIDPRDDEAGLSNTVDRLRAMFGEKTSIITEQKALRDFHPGDKKFHLITAIQMLYFVRYERALPRMVNMLAPGGKLVVALRRHQGICALREDFRKLAGVPFLDWLGIHDGLVLQYLEGTDFRYKHDVLERTCDTTLCRDPTSRDGQLLASYLLSKDKMDIGKLEPAQAEQARQLVLAHSHPVSDGTLAFDHPIGVITIYAPSA